MTNSKTTRRALLSSVVSLLLCFAMLIGTTFAWFTDSVSSVKNQIVAGNLDVELEYNKVVDGKLVGWQTVEDAEDVFDPNALWEPGRVEVVYLKVSNLGTLALKYQLGVNVYNEVVGKNEKGEDIRLSDHLVFKVTDIEADEVGSFDTRAEAIAAAGTEKGLKDYNGTTTSLEKGEADYVAMIVYMPESVGNEANYRGDAIPTIELGVNLYATQYTSEEDSFGDDYDKNAWADGMVVYDEADLKAALANDGKVKLGADITLNSRAVVPEGVTVTLDMNGKTITGPSSNYAIRNNGILTITGNGTIQGDFGALSTGGRVVIEDGTYISNGVAETTHHCIYVGTGGDLVINGGTFNHNGAGTSDSGAVVTIYDYAGTGASLEITGGTFIGSGTYISAVDKYDSTSTLKITGGAFSENVNSMVADGYKAVKLGELYYVVSNNTVTTVAEANKMLSEGTTDVILFGANEPEGVVSIPEDYTGKLTLNNSKIASVQAEGDADIEIVGDVEVIAVADNCSAITANGALNISGNGNLTAIANDETNDKTHAYGIGGDATTAITINDVHIVNVKGGLVQATLADDDLWGKSAAEGGAAIGSATDGAVITLNNVTIDNAQGGSKAAGIGAEYWTGVTINITDSTILNVEGGACAAGIGGSRVVKVPTADDAITVNIVNSKINATGGQYAAAIGSGYDTYCHSVAVAPVTTVTIDAASEITAQGGKLAAGIGTGHNAVNFVGNIACDTSNVKAGDSNDVDCGGAEVSTAQDVGLGSLKIEEFAVIDSTALDTAIQNGEKNIFLADGTYQMPASAKGQTLTITGLGDSVIEVVPGGQSEAGGQLDYNLDGSTVTFNNLTIKTNSNLYAGYARLSGTYNNCVIQNTYNLGTGNSAFYDCTINITNEYLRVGGAYSAIFDGCTFNTDGRAILVYQDGTSVDQTVTVKDCTFNATAAAKTWNGIHVSAVSIDGTSGTYTVNLEGNNTVDSDFNGLWQIKAGEANVTVNE